MWLWQDLRYAARLLLKDRWFTAIAAAALALGIGVNATVFTLVNAALIRGLPFEHPDEIVSVDTVDPSGRLMSASLLDFQDWAAARSFSGLAASIGSALPLSEPGRPAEQVNGTFASASMFSLLGVRPALGRAFERRDDRAGAEAVCLLSDTIWKSHFGGDPTVVGRPIRVDDEVATVVGVMPPKMQFPFNTEVWLPLSQVAPAVRVAKRNLRSFQVIGRLAPGVTVAQAFSEMQNIAAQLGRQYPDTNKDYRVSVMPYADLAIGPQRRTMFLALMGAVAFVLLIACANVANLLLARASRRSREIAVRVALGATRFRIVRQLLVESVLLASLAGAIGLGIGRLGLAAVDRVFTASIGRPYWLTFTMDPIVFGFVAAICLGTAVLFGLAPALHVSRTDVREVLTEGGRSGIGGTRARRWTSALIVVEVALTLVLLAGAGFMMRSFMSLYNEDLGVDTSHLLTMRLTLPFTGYANREKRIALFDRFEERLGAISAIQASGITSNPPLFGGAARQLVIDGRPTPAGLTPPEVTVVDATTGYLAALGVHIIRGRNFDAADGTPGHENTIVNERFVSMHFGVENPVGRQIRLIDANPARVYDAAPPLDLTIVGVVPSVRQRGREQGQVDPVVYVPMREDPQRYVSVVVRTAAKPAAVAGLVRQEMQALDQDLPVTDIETMDDLLALLRWLPRTFGSMFAVFALIALVLSAVGLYAVTMYSVSQRTAEIGVRMAVGARPRQVLWLVLRRALGQLAVGVPLGVAGALAVGRLLQGVVGKAGGGDPLTLGGIVAVMLAVSSLACYWPARRATAVDPVVALRHE
ncbi:MAG TPA: ABC transporter permease [Vicinamibacterales bacterium]|jgi:predicted permease|nr:ABC transporter permease [Vicinamibacterales bacterium]